jgi:ABC-type multidrug transport system ATPase subunit
MSFGKAANIAMHLTWPFRLPSHPSWDAKKVGLFSQSSGHEEVAPGALDVFGMADMAQRPLHKMSGGQRQLVIFARALVAEADILILDEPTSALDLKNQANVLESIETLARKDRLTVILTTHHPHHALATADNVLLMLGEEPYLTGLATKALIEDNLEELFGVAMKRINFDHNGHSIETLTPSSSTKASAQQQKSSDHFPICSDSPSQQDLTAIFQMHICLNQAWYNGEYVQKQSPAAK